MEEKNWGADPRRAPTLQEGDELLYDECGRVHEKGTWGNSANCGIDYRSHYFRIVKAQYGGCWLLVKHGGGEERIQLDYNVHHVKLIFDLLCSDRRYLLMHMLHSVHREALKQGQDDTARHYQKAFIEGRLKKRKLPKQDAVKVWIEHQEAVTSCAT
jgi:hypothetical protein